MFYFSLYFVLGLLLMFGQNVWAVENNSAVLVSNDVIVTAEKENAYLPDVQGANIYSGKKTSVIDLQNSPEIVNNNFRQVLHKTPSLLLSEESSPLLSVGYRGLEPHRAQFTQVLKDGIPIHADMFGYPEAYYTPPLEVVDRIEFIHGGASLLYGPQPGGALNFITKDPYANGPVSWTMQNSVGSHDLFSHFTSLSGTRNDLGYYGYFHHRQSQGFRDNNSQSDVFYGGSKFKMKQDQHQSWTVAFDAYNEEHGEPGGLTRADFDANPSKTNRLNDHFELDRYAGSIAYDHDIDDDLYLQAKAFGGYYERASWRQRTSVSNFGLAPGGANASSNDIENQKFYTAGTELRTRKNYDAFNTQDHALTLGALYYHVTSPRIDKRGATADAIDGSLRKDSDRQMNYLSLFLENLFKIEKLSLTPGVRLENIWQGIKENVNLDKTTVPLADEHEYDFVALFGLGAKYDVGQNMEAYGNISQGYRPKIFTQAVPTGSGQVVNDDLQEGKSWQTDLGLRATPTSFYTWDASWFYMEFKDQIGTSGSTVENVGDARHQGFELANELDIVGLFDAMNQSSYVEQFGALNLFAGAMILDAEFTNGPNTDKIPQYATDFIFKTGLEYNYNEKAKLRLAGTFVDDHFANDTNTDQFKIPSYKVWDLTGEMDLYKESLSLFAGINNLFDEKYFARVRSDGIDPADGRNYYAGLKMNW